MLKQIVIWTLEEGEKAEAVRRRATQQTDVPRATGQRLTPPVPQDSPSLPRLRRPQPG